MRIEKLLFVTLSAAACYNQPQESTTTATSAAPHTGPVRIGFSMDTLKEERWQRDKQLVEQRAKEVGASLDVQVANGDDAVQTKQADNMLTKGVDVLIVAPHNGEIAASIVEAAHRKGVPVISYDRLIRNADVDLYVSHQVERIGEMQAEYALKHSIQRIVKGTQTMTIYKPIQPLAFSAVDAAIKLARKEKVNAPDKINNGKKDVPAILITPISVDKSNVDATVIKDGYHTHAEIYGQ